MGGGGGGGAVCNAYWQLGLKKARIKLQHLLLGVVTRDVTRGTFFLDCIRVAATYTTDAHMAELSGEESDYHSSHTSSLENSQSESDLSLSCEFSSFESGGSESETAEREPAVVEPYQYEPLDSQSSSCSNSADGSSDDESAGANRLLNTDW